MQKELSSDWSLFLPEGVSKCAGREGQGEKDKFTGRDRGTIQAE